MKIHWLTKQLMDNPTKPYVCACGTLVYNNSDDAIIEIHNPNMHTQRFWEQEHVCGRSAKIPVQNKKRRIMRKQRNIHRRITCHT